MNKTTEYTAEINILISYVMEYFEEKEKEEDQIMIGGYSEHFISERFSYIVALNPQGRLEMSREVVQDYHATKEVSNEAIEKIAKSYKPQ